MFIELLNIKQNNARVFRDDLYPSLGGGNKGRKMHNIAKDIALKNANAIVTTGGIQSNHCRAVAIFAAQNNMKCSLVLHGDKERFSIETGNAMIMRLSGAKIIFADDSSKIGSLMDMEMNNYKESGFNPYYIWGGGHTLEGGEAYVNAIGDLYNYTLKENWVPSYIFLASGTGSTQSGILAGLDKFKFTNTKVIGISVARKSEQAELIVKDFYKEICEANNIEINDNEVIVLDDYLCGGYEQSNNKLNEISNRSILNHGFVLDKTYSGKAFYGMLDYIKKNNIKENVLFWHTGGVFNFLAQ
mgnify:CR=1 FL=1